MKLIIDDDLVVQSDSLTENGAIGNTVIFKGYHYRRIIYVKSDITDGQLKMDMSGNGNDNALKYDA